jgi:hypothetical protein
MRITTNIHEEPITKIEDHVQDPMDDTSTTLSKMTQKKKKLISTDIVSQVPPCIFVMLRLLNGKIIVFEFLKDKSKQHYFKNKIKILN